MNLKILSAAFLIGVSGTSLLAQPTPPTPVTCTNTSDTTCVGLATVYNAIIATNPPVPATTSLQTDIFAVLRMNLKNNPPQQCNTIMTNCKSNPSAPGCNTPAYTTVMTACNTFQNNMIQSNSILGQIATAIPQVIQNQWNMDVFNKENGQIISQILSLFNAVNAVDSAISAYPTSSISGSQINKSSPAPRAPAAPAKVAPAKK